MSPVQEPSRDLPGIDGPLLSRRDSSPNSTESRKPQSTPEPPLRTSLYRSNTSSSIPTMSPSIKRMSMRAPDSPLVQSHLARSTTTRNLASQAASPNSPARSRPPSVPPVAAKVDRNQMARTRGFKLLHDLQSKLGTAQTNLARAPKRLTSGSLPGASKRTVSNATVRPTKPEKQAELPPLPQASTHTPIDADKSGATFLSPNGWVLVSDNDETPPANGHLLPPHISNRPEPDSPLVDAVNYRSASSASHSKPLPTRPGIPSPLASSLSRSATSSHLARSTRTPTTRVTNSAYSTRPQSRTEVREKATSRPMSPSMLPQPTRSKLRSPTPTFGQAISSASSSANPSRPLSRSAHRTLGRGPPPVTTKQFPPSNHLSQSTNVSTPTGLRRSSRRSSLGTADAARASGIPTPARTPSRPISMHTYDGTPPPVPRIPSAHKRGASKDGSLVSTSDRTRKVADR